MLIEATPTYNRIREASERIVFLRGGARSGKSFALMQVAMLWLYTGKIGGKYVPDGIFTIVRLTFPALRATVYRDFIEYAHALDIYKYLDHRKTTNEFYYNKRCVSFIPADSEQKLRGRKHTFVWLNEVNDIPFEVFHQVSIRTERQVFMDVNPSGHPWARTEIEDKRMEEVGDVFLDVSTYHDNPFLTSTIRQEIENLKFTDEGLYRIYAKGEWTELKGVIFPNIELVDNFPSGCRIYYGLDFGWNDPSVLVKVGLDGINLYCQTLIYRRGLLLDQMASLILQQGITDKVFCDASEPRTIEELKRRGITARAAKKGPDSILNGLTFLKQHRIFLTKDSVESISEFQRYKWNEDKDGNLEDKPIDKYNHTADSMRYAVSRALGGRLKLIR